MNTTRFFWPTFIACVLCASKAMANIGQSSKDVAGRYGPGETVEATKPAEEAQTFSFDGMKILVEYWKGQSCSEQYQKAEGSELSDAEIHALLTSNAKELSWYPASGDVWVREDKSAIAYMGNNRKALIVQTYDFHVEEKKRREQTGKGDKPKPYVASVAPRSMTKIVLRHIAPDVRADSFAAKPKTLYLAGDTYVRVEEEPDPEQRIHGLMICSEPDIWMINLMGYQGQHIVDPGPTFITHNPVINKDAPGEFGSLEIGKEVTFFENHHAAHLATQTIDGQSCEVSEVKQANYRVVLNVSADTHKPFQLDVFKDGKPDFSIRYVSYEADLPFDPALFTPPSDVTLIDEKSKP